MPRSPGRLALNLRCFAGKTFGLRTFVGSTHGRQTFDAPGLLPPEGGYFDHGLVERLQDGVHRIDRGWCVGMRFGSSHEAASLGSGTKSIGTSAPRGAGSTRSKRSSSGSLTWVGWSCASENGLSTARTPRARHGRPARPALPRAAQKVRARQRPTLATGSASTTGQGIRVVLAWSSNGGAAGGGVAKS